MAMFISAPTKINPLRIGIPLLPPTTATNRVAFKRTRCAPPLQQQQVEEEEEAVADTVKVASGIACEPCNGRGWLICDFCKGQKTNVKAANKRIYRRCPTCRAVGYVLCSNCKVFKCVTFPNASDGEELSL